MPHGMGRRTITRLPGRDAGGDSVSRTRRGSVAASPESTLSSVELRGIGSTAAIAVSSWLSLPWRSPSADSGTSTSGSTGGWPLCSGRRFGCRMETSSR
jgi:hypothetical protein